MSDELRVTGYELRVMSCEGKGQRNRGSEGKESGLVVQWKEERVERSRELVADGRRQVRCASYQVPVVSPKW